jgi:uncharacterized membrane protein YphA (DoxX/SURF4 family)
MRHIAARAAYDSRMKWARIILGVVLLAMGAGKLADVGGYAAALSTFRVIPDGALHVVAIAWLCAELAAGALLVAGVRTARIGAPLAVCVNVAYAALTTQAYVRHLRVDNCTCFGVHLAQRLSWFVLVQDAYMIFLSLWVLRAVYGAASTATRPPPAG